MPLAILALAVSSFGIGTTEFMMMGLLPDVADDLGHPPSGAAVVTASAPLGRRQSAGAEGP